MLQNRRYMYHYDLHLHWFASEIAQEKNKSAFRTGRNTAQLENSIGTRVYLDIQPEVGSDHTSKV